MGWCCPIPLLSLVQGHLLSEEKQIDTIPTSYSCAASLNWYSFILHRYCDKQFPHHTVFALTLHYWSPQMKWHCAEEALRKAKANICWLTCLFMLGAGVVTPEILLLSREQSIKLLEPPLWCVVIRPWLAAKLPHSLSLPFPCEDRHRGQEEGDWKTLRFLYLLWLKYSGKTRVEVGGNHKKAGQQRTCPAIQRESNGLTPTFRTDHSSQVCVSVITANRDSTVGGFGLQSVRQQCHNRPCLALMLSFDLLRALLIHFLQGQLSWNPLEAR